MKRIGILTFHRSINYGAYLQAFALSKEIFKRVGIMPELVDFEYKWKNDSQAQMLNNFFIGKEYQLQYTKFRADLNLLPLSAETFITDDTSQLLNYLQKNYDILIVGSDAVWAYQKMVLDNPYWLFGDKLDCIKMSFAASAYSTDFNAVTDAERMYIKNHLKSFDYIGVRDEETSNFIHQILPEKEIHRNCDPTVLLKGGDTKIADKICRNKGLHRKKRIATLMIAGNKYVPAVIKKISDHEPIMFYKRNFLKDKYTFGSKGKMLYDLSPFEWYNLYSVSSMNITNYFHGTVVGLRNNVPTIAFDNTNFPYKYIGKIKQFMTDLDLLEFYFHYPSMDKTDEDRLFDQIENIKVNSESIKHKITLSIEKERSKADSFFEQLSKHV
jgi:hypothetical protein